MSDSVAVIPITNLAFMLIPVLLTTVFLYHWLKNHRTISYAFARMITQLILIGYVLNYLFAANHIEVVMAILLFMLVVSSWISLRPLPNKTTACYTRILISIGFGTSITLIFVTQAVLDIEPWFSINLLVPLAGLTFANAMNTVSLVGERFEHAITDGKDYTTARNEALQAGLIPIINMLFAVGLVSIPGIMTGQILAGVSPLIAVRYQIMVMAMLFSASGLAAVCYLFLARK